MDSFLWILFLISISTGLVESILDGDRVDWSRTRSYSYTGSTQREGQYDELYRLKQLVVQLRKEKRREEWFNADLIHRTDNWVLLKIAKQNITQLRAPLGVSTEPEPLVYVAFNVKIPSPKGTLLSTRLTIFCDRKKVSSICAFKIFINYSLHYFIEVLRLDLLMLHPSTDGHYRSKVVGDYTACFDDAGAPVLCRLLGRSDDIQIGLFQSLKMHEGPKAKVLDTKENCARAAQMEFSITTVDEDHGQSELVDIYKNCG